MELKQMPPEILGRILGELVEPEDLASRADIINCKDLAACRLVCRGWNGIASRHLFEEIKLIHRGAPYEDQDESEPWGFDRWNAMIDNEMIRTFAQRVIINSAPDDISKSANCTEWFNEWGLWNSEGKHPSFTRSIDRLIELPNATEVRLLFTENCRGKENTESDIGWSDDVEPLATRLNTLKAVFSAMVKRSTDSKNTAIRSLALKNVQNSSLESLVAPEMSTVIKHIRNLQIWVVEEYNEHGPDRDLTFDERRTFEPHLQNEILPNFCDSLTTLSLGFREYWGTAPAYFDGKGLIFPCLKTLDLIQFAISHHDHFDWVISQTSLTTLRLDNCSIVSHLCFDWDEKTKDVPNHDWELLPRGSFGQCFEDILYTFSGTWAAEFDKIRTSLTKLVDFQFGNLDHRNEDSTFEDFGRMETRLYPNRYIAFEAGTCPSPWIEGDADGVLEFGNGLPDPPGDDAEESENDEEEDYELNRAKETETEDSRALSALMQAIQERSQMMKVA